MDTADIKNRILEIITQVTNLPADGIGDDDSFVEDLDLDSLALLEIGVDVDHAFQLGLPDERLKEMGSLRQAVELVQRELAARQNRAEVA